MNLRQHLDRVPLFTLMTGISLAMGLIVPTVFEWSEKPAARSRHPEMERTAIIVIVISLIIAAIIWFLRKPSESIDNSNLAKSFRPIQFRLRDIFIATTLVAVFIAVAPLIKWPLTNGAVIGVTIGMLGWSFFQGSSVRSRVGALLVCTFLPFAWIIPTNVPFGHTSGLISAIPFGPGILPALYLNPGPMDDSTWIAAVFVIFELVVGLFLARRGGKLAVVYIFLILIASSVSSLALHALYRM